jgi:cytochrome b subunit of formate dehydrogenase
MLCGGVLAVLQGVAALAEDDIYARVGSYVYGLGLTAWGFVHVVLGVLAAVTGAALLKDAAWARLTGILLASLSLVAQFLFLPYEPLWSVVVMAIDVVVIRALALRRRARTDDFSNTFT